MKFALRLGFILVLHASAAPTKHKRDVDNRYPYTGPAVPVGDWVDPTINGNGKGFPRLVEPPAVKPASNKPSNNVNVISLSYLPDGVNIHYRTPFRLNGAPTVHWGTSPWDLRYTVSGQTSTYDHTPPCSEVVVTQCSQYFHDVQLRKLNQTQPIST